MESIWNYNHVIVISKFSKEQAFILIEEDNKKKLEYAEKSKETRAKNKAEKDQMKSDKN